ncbi:hypothetical protein ACN47E_001430 [Coniothyrium glycines]
MIAQETGATNQAGASIEAPDNGSLRKEPKKGKRKKVKKVFRDGLKTTYDALKPASTGTNMTHSSQGTSDHTGSKSDSKSKHNSQASTSVEEIHRHEHPPSQSGRVHVEKSPGELPNKPSASTTLSKDNRVFNPHIQGFLSASAPYSTSAEMIYHNSTVSSSSHGTDMVIAPSLRLKQSSGSQPTSRIDSLNYTVQPDFEFQPPLGDGTFTRSAARHFNPHDDPASLSLQKVKSIDTQLALIPGPSTEYFSEDQAIEEDSKSCIYEEEVRKIQFAIWQIDCAFRDLQRPMQETPTEGVQRVLSHYRAMRQSCASTFELYNDIRLRLQEREGQAGDYRKLEHQFENTKQMLEAQNQEVTRVLQDLTNKNYEVIRLQERLAQRETDHQNNLEEFATKFNALRSTHNSDLSVERAQFETEKETLNRLRSEEAKTARIEEQKLHEATITKLKQELREQDRLWKTHVQTLKNDHEARIKDDQAKFKQDETTLREHYDYQIAQQEDKYNKMCSEWEETLTKHTIKAVQDQKELEEKLQEEQAKLVDEQQRHMEELKAQQEILKQQHTAYTQKLRSTNEELKKGLHERKHFRGLRDRDVSSRFATILGHIQDFANLQWDTRKQSTWPLDEQKLLSYNQNNPRKLKKQIIQNSMWVLLYDSIFASPFKILGQIGETIDKEWKNIYGTDASSLEWPDITTETEKKRIETAHNLLGAMEPSANVTGYTLQLKLGYEDSIAETAKALWNGLEKVAVLDARQKKVLDSLLRLCAKTWMEFCSQPYRLLLKMPEGSGDLLHDRTVIEPALTLVIKPEMKRYGDSQGENLGRGELLPDGRAEVQSYTIT